MLASRLMCWEGASGPVSASRALTTTAAVTSATDVLKCRQNRRTAGCRSARRASPAQATAAVAELTSCGIQLVQAGATGPASWTPNQTTLRPGPRASPALPTVTSPHRLARRCRIPMGTATSAPVRPA